MSYNLRNRGFSLIEIMVAVAILSISLLVLLRTSGNTLVNSRRSEIMTIAVMLARQKMTDIEIDLYEQMRRNEFPDERSEDGDFDEPYEDFKWKMEIKKVELPAPSMGDEGSIQDMVGRQLTKEIGKTVRELTLTIEWQELDELQSIDIVTHITKL